MHRAFLRCNASCELVPRGVPHAFTRRLGTVHHTRGANGTLRKHAPFEAVIWGMAGLPPLPSTRTCEGARDKGRDPLLRRRWLACSAGQTGLVRPPFCTRSSWAVLPVWGYMVCIRSEVTHCTAVACVLAPLGPAIHGTGRGVVLGPTSKGLIRRHSAQCTALIVGHFWMTAWRLGAIPGDFQLVAFGGRRKTTTWD